MSELSLLIENQNEVKVDQSYLQKCNKKTSQNEHEQNSISQNMRALSSKQIKINPSFQANRKKHFSPRSINDFSQNRHGIQKKDGGKSVNTNTEKQEDSNEKLYKIGIRVDAFEQNMKRLQTRYGKQFFKLQEQIFKRKNDSNIIFEDLKKVRATIDETKKNIGTVLNTIAKQN